MSKGRYQDNLEFIQWLKRYFDIHSKNDPKSYDAPALRKNAAVDFSFVDIRNPLKQYTLFHSEGQRTVKKMRINPARIFAKLEALMKRFVQR